MRVQVSPEFGLEYRDLVLGEMWPMEAKLTAEVIRRIPPDKGGYRPHDKSRTAIELAQHIVQMEAMFADAILDGEFNSKRSEEKLGVLPTEPDKLANWYLRWREATGARLAKVSEVVLMEPITMAPPMPAMPAFHYLMWLIHHTIHHRGQLDVYLRLMGAKLPAIYGDSADEKYPKQK